MELREHVLVAVTGVFTPSQAYLAAEAGARYVIPYVNRLTRYVGDCPAAVRPIDSALSRTQCEKLLAGMKSPTEATDVVRAWARHVSVPLEVLQTMVDDALKEKARQEFDAAIRTQKDLSSLPIGAPEALEQSSTLSRFCISFLAGWVHGWQSSDARYLMPLNGSPHRILTNGKRLLKAPAGGG